MSSTRRLFLKGAVAAIGAVSGVRLVAGSAAAVGVDPALAGSERSDVLVYAGVAKQRAQALAESMRQTMRAVATVAT